MNRNIGMHRDTSLLLLWLTANLDHMRIFKILRFSCLYEDGDRDIFNRGTVFVLFPFWETQTPFMSRCTKLKFDIFPENVVVWTEPEKKKNKRKEKLWLPVIFFELKKHFVFEVKHLQDPKKKSSYFWIMYLRVHSHQDSLGESMLLGGESQKMSHLNFSSSCFFFSSWWRSSLGHLSKMQFESEPKQTWTTSHRYNNCLFRPVSPETTTDREQQKHEEEANLAHWFARNTSSDGLFTTMEHHQIHSVLGFLFLLWC